MLEIDLDNFINSINIKSGNNIKIVFGKLEDNILFNSRIDYTNLNIIPLLTSFFNTNYKIFKKYELYDINNILIKDQYKSINNRIICINYSVHNNYLIKYENIIKDPLITFNCMKKYCNYKKYVALVWDFPSNHYNICCNIFNNYITLEINIYGFNNLNNIIKKIHIFNKILSKIEFNNDGL